MGGQRQLAMHFSDPLPSLLFHCDQSSNWVRAVWPLFVLEPVTAHLHCPTLGSVERDIEGSPHLTPPSADQA
jgi:hypothetical protein